MNVHRYITLIYVLMHTNAKITMYVRLIKNNLRQPNEFVNYPSKNSIF